MAPPELPVVVAVLANATSPYHEHFLRRLAEELSGIEVHALFAYEATFQPWSVALPPGLPVRYFSAEGERASAPSWRHALRDFRKGGRILRHLEASRASAVICQGYNDLAFLRVLLGCGRRRIPVFLRSDSNAADDERNPRWKRAVKAAVLRPLLRRADGVMPAGRAGAAYFERYGVGAERQFLVPYESDVGAIRAVDPNAVRVFAEREGFPADRRRLLFCARLSPVKRPDLALEAFAAIAGRRLEWDLVFAGDGPLRAGLESSVPEALRGRVRWLGFRDVAEVRLAFHACDLLLLPSDLEPWALVVTEALASGLAVVASDVVGAAFDLVTPGENGAIFRRGDIGDLERAVLEATDPERIDRLKAASAGILDRWRRDANPVEGVRAALRAAGIVRA